MCVNQENIECLLYWRRDILAPFEDLLCTEFPTTTLHDMHLNKPFSYTCRNDFSPAMCIPGEIDDVFTVTGERNLIKLEKTDCFVDFPAGSVEELLCVLHVNVTIH